MRSSGFVKRMSACRILRILGVLCVLWGPLVASQSGSTVPSSAAYLLVDLRTGRTLSSSRADVLSSPVAPGSIMKIVTLVAALEEGVVTPATAIVCRRDFTIGSGRDARRLPCVHPDLGRPLLPAEALAHSCNSYVGTIASRVSRSRFNDAAIALGLPPLGATGPMVAAALGVDGIRVAPRQLPEILARLASTPPRLRIRAETREVLLEGLRGSARYGSAAAIGAAGLDALAKTGTAPMTGGGYHGLVIAALPASNPSLAIVVRAPGAAGADAAHIAADVLKARGVPAPPDPAPQAARQRSSAGASGEKDLIAASAGRRVQIGVPGANGGYHVAGVALEEYVAEVLAGEAAQASAPAALEALAVTARTFAIANLGRHRRDGFDLCTLTHCQVARPSTAATRQAARATAGRILTYKGSPASVFYTAWCGGHTEIASQVWPGASDPPFLPSREDPACRDLPGWVSEIPAADLRRALLDAGFRGGDLRALGAVARNLSGRVTRLRLDGLVPTEISGQDFRAAVGRSLGWQLIKSTAFEVSRTATGFRFEGRGSGHGVGLCVTGSARMAAGGIASSKILAAYFPGAEVAAVPAVAFAARTPSRIQLRLPAGEEGEWPVLQALAERTLNALASRIGVAPPDQVRMTFHPTVESFRRATAQPWWTSGALVGDEIHLVPLAALRARDIVEPTLRHELAHALIEDRLKGRPLWVKEGAAIYLAGEDLGPPASRKCPSDGELARSVSAGALRDAYARAAACVARELDKGTRWDEIR